MALSVGVCLNGNNQPAVAIRANQAAMQAIALRGLVHIPGLRYFIFYTPDGQLS